MAEEKNRDEEVREESVARSFDRLALALLLLAVAAVLAEPLRIHHDPANFLTAALTWVEGHARLQDIVGMNLPLARYLYGLPALVSHVLGAHPVPVFSAMTIACLLAAAAACRVLLGGRAPGSATARALIGVAAAGLVLAALEGPELTFGQREVFFVALVLPFLLVRWRRAEGRPPGTAASALAGVAGALGALIKPQLLLPVATAELALWFAGGRPRLVKTPESLAFGATGLAYALHVLLLPDGVLRALGSAVAGAAGGYRAYDASLPNLLLRFSVLPALLVPIAALAASREKAAGPLTRLSATFAGLTLGGLAAYYLQHKGFAYHLVPAVAGTVLSATALIAGEGAARLRQPLSGALRKGERPLRLAAVAAPLCAVALCALAAARLPEALELVPRNPFEELLVESTSRREELLVISTSVLPVYPALLRMDRRPFGLWAGPFMGIAFSHAGDPREGPPRYLRRDEMRDDERWDLDALTRDLKAGPPRLVLIAADPPHQGLPPRFDLVEYLRVAGFLDEALGAFERQKDRAGFAVYELRARP